MAPTDKKKVHTIDITPTWAALHRMCRDGQFSRVYEELLKPCKLLDEINDALNKGGKITIYKDENGEFIMDDGLEDVK